MMRFPKSQKPVRMAKSPDEKQAAALQHGKASKREIALEKAKLRRSGAKVDEQPASPVGIITVAVQGLGSVAKLAVSSLGNLTKKRKDAQKRLREFQAEHGITRPPRMPDRFKTAMAISFAGCAESVFSAALFVADGHMGIGAAFVSGIAVSAVNITAGLAAGFFPGRYIGYRINAETPAEHDGFIRTAAWCGLGIFLTAITTLHLAAARVRVTGSHSDVFDFSEVSFFWGTFGDYYAIALIVLGSIGSMIAFYKGRNGICDPIVGYEDFEAEVIAESEDVYEDARAEIQELYEDAQEDIAQPVDTSAQDNTADAELTLQQRILEHNDLIDAALGDLLAIQAEKQQRLRFVEQSNVVVNEVNVAAFEALRIKDKALSSATTSNVAVMDTGSTASTAALDTAYQMAIKDIDDAYLAFQEAGASNDISLHTPISTATELTLIEGEDYVEID